LNAELNESLLPIVRGPIAGTFDKLGDDSVFKLTKVVQGDIIYKEGVDYRLINQSEIDWSLNTNTTTEPLAGTTYYVSFLYTQALVKDKDYQLTSLDAIKFIDKTPAPNQNFYVTYSYYLAKAGVIYLDKTGIFRYSLSASSINPIPPTIAANLLTIAQFTLYTNKVDLKQSDCTLVSLSELNSLVAQVKQNTYNLESLSLDNKSQLVAISNSIAPIGYYNSTLQDLSKLNLNHSLFTAAISPGIQALTSGYTHKDVPLNMYLEAMY
jgi:hypothetical protein